MPHFQGRLLVRGLTVPTGRNPYGGSAKGGGGSFSRYRREIRKQLMGEAWVTTLLDLYKIPTDTPGFPETRSMPGGQRVKRLQDAVNVDIASRKFRAQLQLHEFEALLFADLECIPQVMEVNPTRFESLKIAVDGLHPEEINQTESGAPSKRLADVYRGGGVAKAEYGPLIAARIGLPKLRARCPHFAEWVDWIEVIAAT